jgi:hypothetical protein
VPQHIAESLRLSAAGFSFFFLRLCLRQLGGIASLKRMSSLSVSLRLTAVCCGTAAKRLARSPTWRGTINPLGDINFRSLNADRDVRAPQNKKRDRLK